MTALHREGMTLNEIANITEHHNLESLKSNLERPTTEDEAKPADTLQCYTKGGSKSLMDALSKKRKSDGNDVVIYDREHRETQKWAKSLDNCIELFPLTSNLVKYYNVQPAMPLVTSIFVALNNEAGKLTCGKPSL